MRTFCIFCPELPERLERAKKHLGEHCPEAEFIAGIHGETFGLIPSRPFRLDHPQRGYLIPISQMGLTLSHYMVWTACSMLRDDWFLILEDDAKFNAKWRERLFEALRDCPKDFDILLVGNSNCSDRPKTIIAGNVWEVKYPFCTHAYIIHRKCLPTLLSFRDAATKIDIGLMLNVYPKLKVYTVIPRIVDQFDTDLLP